MGGYYRYCATAYSHLSAITKMVFVSVFKGYVLGILHRVGKAAQSAPNSAKTRSRASLLSKLAIPIIVITVQALLALASLETLSTLRVFVESESEWSKAQKTSVNFLHQYLDRGEEQDYQKFLAAIATNLGFNAARQALEKPEPDIAAATADLKRVGVESEDVPGMILFFLRFRDYSHFRPAIDIWRNSDAQLAELSALADDIRARLARSESPASDLALRARLQAVDPKVTAMATAFSKSLGAGARAVTRQLAFANIVTACLLMGLVGWRVRALFHRGQRFEADLRGEKEQAQITLQSIADGVIRVDAQARVEYVNPAAERLIGCDQAHAQGRRLSHLIELVDKDAATVPCLDNHAPFTSTGQFTLVISNGRRTPVSVHRAELRSDSASKGVVFVLRDMTRERDLIEQLLLQASYDDLTGLANRRELNRRLCERLATMEAEGGDDALMVLDLDQFKLVNDTCGHVAGDLLLRDIAAILKREVGDQGLPARLGGDEFAVLLMNCNIVRAREIAEKLRESIQDFTFVWQDRAFKIGASIGLAPCVRSRANAEEAFQAADVACYLAKERGRNRLEVHEPSGEEIKKHVSEMGWVHKVRAALDKGHFCLYAQRILSLQDETQGGHFELLVRMFDEQGRPVPPGSFIPAAERYLLMPRIDRFVVKSAFESLAAIVADSDARICFAINLSGQSLGDPTFIDFVQSQFEANRIAPSSIAFEITETVAIGNLDAAIRFIETFKALGCKFMLDDFGAGMSSFGYLKRLPVDFLKIDGGFVKDMLRDPVDRAMVEMIVRMAKMIGIGTIAEFAETAEIVEALRDLGVDHAQGYSLGHPIPLCLEFGRNKLNCCTSRCSSHPACSDESAALCA